MDCGISKNMKLTNAERDRAYQLNGKGIWGNNECIECGACCVLYVIPGFKEKGNDPCEFLKYDPSEKKAQCTIRGQD